MAESIKHRTSGLANKSDSTELRRLFEAVLADLGGTSVSLLAAQFNLLVADAAALRTSHNTLATKLNADAGVTDTDYAAAPAATAAVVTVSAAAAATLAA